MATRLAPIVGQCIDDRAVVAERSFAPCRETISDRFAYVSKVAVNRACIVELIGTADELEVAGGATQMRGHHLLLVATVLRHEYYHLQEVSEVANARAFANLVAKRVGNERECLVKLLGITR